MKVVVLIPAHNEEASIGATIEAVLKQTRPADQIVVIPNGCTDRTACVAYRYPVTVLELPKLAHRKSEALNIAWKQYAQDADIVINLDADTLPEPHAIEHWITELAEPGMGGSSSKFTMQQPGLLSRLQKAEYAAWIDIALRKGYTSVLSGTGCAIKGSVLREIAERDDRVGPWVYTSQVEDFELTYRIRELGYKCQVSPTIRSYTDSMSTVRALWGQRMKWQVGTIEDLLKFGINRLTWFTWWQQCLGLIGLALKALWVAVTIALVSLGGYRFQWGWALIPALFIALEIKKTLRIPHWDKKDMLIAVSFFPTEFFNWLRTAWFVASWWQVLVSRVTHRQKDRWALQYQAEGV